MKTKVNNFASLLLGSITQAHIFHLRTKSYSQHKALQNYYTSVDAFIDSYIETYQGKNKTVLSNYSSYKIIEDTKKINSYFVGLYGYVQEYYKTEKDTTLRNILDSIIQLIDQTIYLLSLK
jgi:DNA-binding ferritin-like protein